MTACEIEVEWRVLPELAEKIALLLTRARSELGITVRIISGYRSVAKQMELKRQGRPAAPPDVSNHTTCPARAVDLSLGFAPTNVQKATLGRIATEIGLRWGGGSSVDPRTGIPSDWNHFDLGPRPR